MKLLKYFTSFLVTFFVVGLIHLLLGVLFFYLLTLSKTTMLIVLFIIIVLLGKFLLRGFVGVLGVLIDWISGISPNKNIALLFVVLVSVVNAIYSIYGVWTSNLENTQGMLVITAFFLLITYSFIKACRGVYLYQKLY